MSVKDKFNEYKKELKDAFDKDEFGMLQMSSKTVDELAKSGYFHRKIESFMYCSEFTEKEITNYFNDECRWIDEDTLGPVHMKNFSKNIFHYVSDVKHETVQCKLWYELIEYYVRLKAESINKN